MSGDQQSQAQAPDEVDEWVQRLSDAKQQQQALSELRPILLRGVSKAIGNRGNDQAFCEDVVQEALIRILDRLEQFSGRSRFLTWAMTITVRIAVDALRRKHVKDVSLQAAVGDNPLSIDVPDASSSPALESQKAELLTVLKDVIETELTTNQREATQALLSGLPVEEIGARSGRNRNAVYKLIHDARSKMKAALELRGYDSDSVLSILA